MENGQLGTSLPILTLHNQSEWDALSGGESTVVTGVVVVQKAFLDENKAAVDALLTEYAASAAYATANVDETAALVEQFDIFKAAVAKIAIPMCNIVFIAWQMYKINYIDE